MASETSGLVDETGQAIGSAAGQVRDAASSLVDEQGRRLRRNTARRPDLAQDLSQTIRARPLTSALVVLGIGILIGRITG